MSNPRLSIIPARAATDPALKPRDLQVLCVLGRHTDEYGWCRRSQVKMAAEMNCGRATVFDAINRLIGAGYLERHEQESDSGRDSAHVYRVILDPKHPDVSSVQDADGPCRYVGTPAGISAPPAGLEPAPPAASGPAPINDPYLTSPSNEQKKERASENMNGNENQYSGSVDDEPKTAAFEKRVIHFVNGVGYHAGIWPKWDNNTTLDWIKRQFAGLSVAERKEAERWRDAYLLDAAERKVKPQPVGAFFRDRLWNALDPEILKKAESAKAQAARAEENKPDGWAAGYGPVGMSRMFALLLDGPADQELAKSSFLPRSMLAKAWPALMRYRDVQQQRSGAVLPKLWHLAGELMEPVPQGTIILAAWKDEFKRRAWPWPSEFDRMQVVFCPRGGPSSIYEFETALRGLGENDGN